MRSLLLVFAIALSLSSHAQVSWEEIDGLAQDAQAQVVEWRRWFHENPELSNREFNTSARVAGILTGMGLEPGTGIAHTGVVAIIEGGKPGPLVAIRADMDGLSVTEETGAELMLKEGIFRQQKPETVFGLHVGINQPAGKIAVRRGPMLAAVDSFELKIKGRQTHGAIPWNGVDPIVVASQIVLGLQTIASRQVDVTKAPSIVTVGRIAGAVRNNVISDSVVMGGTIRTFDAAMREQIHMRIERTARLIAESAGASIEFELNYGYPATINDAALTEKMTPTLQRE